MTCPRPTRLGSGHDESGCNYQDWRIYACDTSDRGGADDTGDALGDILKSPSFASAHIRGVIRMSNRWRIFYCNT